MTVRRKLSRLTTEPGERFPILESVCVGDFEAARWILIGLRKLGGVCEDCFLCFVAGVEEKSPWNFTIAQ